MKIITHLINRVKSRFIGALSRKASNPTALRCLPDTFELSWESRMAKLAKQNRTKHKGGLSFIKKIFREIPHLDRQTVKTLNSQNIDDFVASARKIICKAKEIPEDLYMDIYSLDLNNKIGAVYDWSKHHIVFNNLQFNGKRCAIFDVLTHEITHAKQNLDILRTKNLGKKHVEWMSKIRAYESINALKNLSNEQIETAIKNVSDNDKKILQSILNARSKGKVYEEALWKNLYTKSINENRKLVQKFRQSVIDRMGIIPETSNEFRLNSRIANDLYTQMKPNKNLILRNSVSYEHEPYCAGHLASLSYLYHTFF